MIQNRLTESLILNRKHPTVTPDEQAKWGEDAKCAVRKGNELTRSSTTES